MLNFRDFDAAAIEGGSGDNQDRRVDQERPVHGNGRVDEVVSAGLGHGRAASRNIAALYQRRMQIEVVRHHRGAEDADGHVELRAGEQVRHEPRGHPRNRRLAQKHLDEKAAADGCHQHQNEGLELANAKLLNQQQQEHVATGDQNAPENRDAHEQIQADRRAEHFRQIAGGNGDFAKAEENVVHRARVIVVACLGQVAAGHQPQPGAQGLQQNGHGVAHQQDPDQPVTELGAALKVGGPVAGVHIAHGNQVRRTGKRKQATPPPAGGDGHRAMNVLDRSFRLRAVGRCRHGPFQSRNLRETPAVPGDSFVTAEL